MKTEVITQKAPETFKVNTVKGAKTDVARSKNIRHEYHAPTKTERDKVIEERQKNRILSANSTLEKSTNEETEYKGK